MRTIDVIDSHTAGEPTRVVVAGGPDLGAGDLADRLEEFRRRHDHFRSAVVNEPRGGDAMVGALLCTPTRADCVAGVIFFNNVGFLGMCGHATIGVAATLAHLGRIAVGRHRLETPVGVVPFDYQGDGRTSFDNVPSWRRAKEVVVEAAGFGRITGDVAWGGNWFFLVENHGLELSPSQIPRLTELAGRLRRAVNAAGHPEVDHVELFGPPSSKNAHSRNFVLCPGGAYDRSPCGTGSSAKLACLAAD
ncbi:MAG: proline racemase family protein, partial [Planctomycetia bacterium]